jgi:hypothetical protein
MNFQDADNSMPDVIYEGYKFPHNYVIFGDVNIYELNEDNSRAIVYIGNRSAIQSLISDIAERLKDYDYSNDNFIVVGLWDNHIEKRDDDYIMLSTLFSHNINNNPLEYIKNPNTVHQLTDDSTSDSDAWRAWGNLSNDYLYNVKSQAETQKVATVLLSNVSQNMLNNFRTHTEDDFLKNLIPSARKLML